MHDILREPKLKPHFPKLKGRDEWELVGVLPSPCPFLKNNRCSIYPTRPYKCVTFLAGNEQCKMARGEPNDWRKENEQKQTNRAAD